MNHWSAAGDISRNIVRDKCLYSRMIVRSGRAHLFSECDTRSLGHQFGLMMKKYTKTLFSCRNSISSFPSASESLVWQVINISITIWVSVIWTSSLFRTYSRDFKSLNFPCSYITRDGSTPRSQIFDPLSGVPNTIAAITPLDIQGPPIHVLTL